MIQSCHVQVFPTGRRDVKGGRHDGHPTVTGGGRGDPSPGKKGAQKETRKEKGERHHDHPTGMGGGRGDPSPGNKKARPRGMGDTHQVGTPPATRGTENQ